MSKTPRRMPWCGGFLWCGIAAVIPATVGRVDGGPWESIGPAPITTGPWTGRVSAVVCSPTQIGRYFVAGADGGVWRTLDGGATWTPLTDDLPRCAIGALALDPADENVLYAGSGEANFANHSRYGAGVYKSSDGGDTWQVLGAEVFAGRCISRLIVDPQDQAILYAAVTHAGGFPARVAARGHPQADGSVGVFKSVDGGMTWAQLLTGLPNLDATDLVMHPQNPAVLYAGIGHIFGNAANGVYRSFDAGASWVKLGGGLPVSNVGRLALAAAPSLPSRVYALVARAADASGNASSTLNVYRSSDGGETWQPTNPGNFQATYGWYLCTITVKPNNPDVVIAGGLSLLRSTNGGTNWVSRTPPHVDVHALAYDAGLRLVVGDDGGMHRSANDGDSWLPLNDGLSLIQFYAGISLSATKATFVLGGLQDNGTVGREGEGVLWTHFLGGDGGWTSHHPAVAGRYFAEFQGTGNLYRLTNFGTSVQFAGSGITGSDRNAFLPPHVIDPGNPNHLLYGTHRVWESVNGGNNWAPISGDLTAGPPAAIRSLAIAPSNPTVVYAATNDGRVLVSDDGGQNWTLRRSGVPGWMRVTREIAVDPGDDGRAYLAVSWFGTDQILETQDRGATWSPIDSDLPDVPVNTVAVHRTGSRREVYLGTDAGVYRRAGSSGHWSTFGTGMPNVPVCDLVVDAPRRRLVAATEGRGAWTLALPVSGDADDDADSDLFDYAALNDCVSGPFQAPGFAPPSDACREWFDFDADSDIDMIDFGFFSLGFSGGCAVTITSPPQDFQACLGGSAMFQVETLGPVTGYQWRHNDVILAGATNSTLTLDPVLSDSVGQYTATVTSACDYQTSEPATLTLAPPPQFLSVPESVTVCPGLSAAFSVAVLAQEPLTYQWQHDGVDLPAGTGPTLTVSAAQSADEGAYRCRVRDACGQVGTSPAATLAVDHLLFLSQPEGAVVCTGDALFLFVSTTESASFQWYKDGQPILGATEFFYGIISATPADAGTYLVIAFDPCGLIVSDPAAVQVKDCGTGP